MSTKWTIAWFCASCNTRLTRHQYSYSNGVCPYCGYIDSSTFCKVKERAVRQVNTTNYPWWMFWKRNIYRTEYKDN